MYQRWYTVISSEVGWEVGVMTCRVKVREVNGRMDGRTDGRTEDGRDRNTKSRIEHRRWCYLLVKGWAEVGAGGPSMCHDRLIE